MYSADADGHFFIFFLFFGLYGQIRAIRVNMSK